MRTAIALGSNVGDRLANLAAGRDAVLRIAGVSEPVSLSRVYETEPVGAEPDAAAFLNAVIEVTFSGEPDALLDALRGIEAALGRPSRRPRNAPRTLDLDILYLGDLVISRSDLTIPHPRLHERRFVLAPLNDIRPDLRLPGQDRTIAGLLAHLEDPASVELFASTW
ncbi:MAG: 2-amino-4-hydroxy-6-hydroxymethyldihydropteridine diphosphokinase [Chthoniobacteraceae bacterium]